MHEKNRHHSLLPKYFLSPGNPLMYMKLKCPLTLFSETAICLQMPVGSDQLALTKKMFNVIFFKEVYPIANTCSTNKQYYTREGIWFSVHERNSFCRIIYCKTYSFSELARSVVEESLVESGQPLGILKTLRQSTGPGDGILPRVSYCIIF